MSITVDFAAINAPMVIRNVTMVCANARMANRPVRMKMKHVASISKAMIKIADNADLNAKIMKHAQVANVTAVAKMELSVANLKRVAMMANVTAATKMELSVANLKHAQVANAIVETKKAPSAMKTNGVMSTIAVDAATGPVAARAINATTVNAFVKKTSTHVIPMKPVIVMEIVYVAKSNVVTMKNVAVITNVTAVAKFAMKMRHVTHTAAVDAETDPVAARGISAKTISMIHTVFVMQVAALVILQWNVIPTKPVHGFVLQIKPVTMIQKRKTSVPAAEPIDANTRIPII